MDAFYKPNDNITALLKAVLKDYENLPANFYYYKDIKERYGLPLLELEEEYIKPIKVTPLLSKLENGDYQTDKSKSDLNIVKDINIFINNLPSFKEYKIIINNHKTLILLILEYYKIKNASLNALEGRMTGIL